MGPIFGGGIAKDALTGDGLFIVIFYVIVLYLHLSTLLFIEFHCGSNIWRESRRMPLRGWTIYFFVIVYRIVLYLLLFIKFHCGSNIGGGQVAKNALIP